MSTDNEPKINEKKSGSDEYRMVVYRSDDFQEVRSFNLTLSSIYVFSSIVILILCALIFSLLSFTPLKRLIPGYGKIESNQQMMELVSGVDELSEQIEAQGVYLQALRTLLRTGLSETKNAALPQADPTTNYSVSNNISPSSIPITSNQMKPAPFPNIDIRAGSELYDALSGRKALNPVNGLVSSEFDPDIKHYGVDILAPSQTPVIAMMDGFVFNSGWDLETGYTIGIQHADNILSFYKHNSQLLKEKGTFVRAGEAIAIIGNTGTLSNGPHLHFEIWHNGKPVNPQEILNFN